MTIEIKKAKSDIEEITFGGACVADGCECINKISVFVDDGVWYASIDDGNSMIPEKQISDAIKALQAIEDSFKRMMPKKKDK